jgi:hypothetical protein
MINTVTGFNGWRLCTGHGHGLPTGLQNQEARVHVAVARNCQHVKALMACGFFFRPHLFSRQAFAAISIRPPFTDHTLTKFLSHRINIRTDLAVVEMQNDA